MIDGEGERQSRRRDPSVDPETVDALESVDEGEPYTPPTGNPSAPAADGLTDEALATAVRRELRRDPATADLDLEVGAEGTTVTLRGTVGDLVDLDDALAVAGRVTGASEIVDEIDVAESAT